MPALVGERKDLAGRPRAPAHRREAGARPPRFATLGSTMTPRLPPLGALLLALVAAAACGEAHDDRAVRELDDPELVSECQRARLEVGQEGLDGRRAHGCYRSASAVGGLCNETVFANCNTQPLSPCVAPAADAPIRSCGATVGELLRCEVANGQQYAAYRTVTCAMPPTSQPSPAKELPECEALCRKCPQMPGCQ